MDVWSLAAVACGGALGSVGRWRIGEALREVAPGLPVGTFAANVAAALVIGVVSGLAAASPMPERVRLLLAVGLCGGLSTFSTFSNETLALVEAGQWGMAVANAVASVVMCVAMVWVGTRVAGVLAAS